MVAAVARASHFGPAVENVLNGEVDVITTTKACNLYAIRETRQRPMGPTTPAVLQEKDIAETKLMVMTKVSLRT